MFPGSGLAFFLSCCSNGTNLFPHNLQIRNVVLSAKGTDFLAAAYSLTIFIFQTQSSLNYSKLPWLWTFLWKAQTSLSRLFYLPPPKNPLQQSCTAANTLVCIPVSIPVISNHILIKTGKIFQKGQNKEKGKIITVPLCSGLMTSITKAICFLPTMLYPQN